jgi:DNA primase
MTWHEKTRRVLIPIYDNDRLVAITGRSVHGERPKYLALGGDANTIYRLPHRADTATVVVEDILSAIAIWRAGHNALAVLGTSITPVQAAEIAAGASHVIGWFDGDKAGDVAWSKLRGRMALHPVKLTRIRTSDDPKRLHRADLLRLLAQHKGT